MQRQPLQLSLLGLLGLIACIAFNLWLFRVGVFWGIVGLNLTKHVSIAYLCQILGVNRKPSGKSAPGPASTRGDVRGKPSPIA